MRIKEKGREQSIFLYNLGRAGPTEQPGDCPYGSVGCTLAVHLYFPSCCLWSNIDQHHQTHVLRYLIEYVAGNQDTTSVDGSTQTSTFYGEKAVGAKRKPLRETVDQTEK